MQSINVNYTIQITLNDTVYSNQFTLSKDFEYTITSEDNTLYGNSYVVSNEYILDYFKEEIEEYLASSERSNDLLNNGLEIVSFELFSDTEGIDIYFESSDDSQYTLYPSIIVYVYKDNIKLQTPTLYCELLSNNTIKWYFDDDGFAHYLYDENNNLIYNLPIGVTYFIESDLKYETTYYRKIVSYNSEFTSKESNLAKITTESEYVDIELNQFKEETKNTIYDTDEIKEVNEKLIAFKSGIGDGNDCLIKKNISEKINIDVPIEININADYDKTLDFYPKVTFGYRDTLKYNYIENIRTATLDMQIKAYPILHMKVRLYAYAVKPIKVDYKISADYTFIYMDGNTAKTQSGNMALRESLTLNADLNNVEYSSKGYATMKTINRIISGHTIRENIITHVKDRHQDKYKDGCQIQVYNYRFYDSYITDDDGNAESISDSGNGSIIVEFEGDVNNSKLYIRGIPNLQLYTYELIKDIEYNKYDGNPNIFTNEEVHGTLKNVINGTDYDNTGTEIKYNIEILESDSDSTISDVKDGEGLSIESDKEYISDILHYEFDKTNYFLNVSYIDIFPDIEDKYNYKFVTEIIKAVGEDGECEPNIWRKAYQKINTGDIIQEIASPYSDTSYESRMYGIERTGYDIYPKEYEDPFHGTINGNETNILSQNGQETYYDRIYQFPLNPNWYNIEYGIKLEDEDVTPSEAKGSISYYFPATNNVITNIPQDLCIFTSDYHKNQTIKLNKNIASYYNIENISNDQENEFIYNIPYSDISDCYNFTIEINKDNEGVLVTDKYLENKDGYFKVSVTLQAFHHPSFKWSPLIHNGFYYINQDENFIYNETNLNASKSLLKERYSNIEVIILLTITLTNSNVISKNISGLIQADTLDHIIISDVKNYIENFIEKKGLKKYDIEDYEFSLITDNCDFNYSDNKIQCSSLEVVTEYYTDNYFNIKSNSITLSPMPKQFCPITILTGDGSTLINIAEINNKDNALFIKEKYNIERNTYSILTKYNNIDINSLIISINDEEVADGYIVTNNSIIFNNELNKGDLVEIKYKINNAFNVIYNVEKDSITININSDIDLSNTYINYETSNDCNYRLLDHLSLNPVHNTRYSGFIYLTNEFKEGYYLNIYQSDTYLFYDSNDRTRIYIELLDNDKNPVENEYIEVISSGKGEIKCENNYTDSNGVIVIEYYPKELGTDKIIAKHKLLETSSNILIKERML